MPWEAQTQRYHTCTSMGDHVTQSNPQRFWSKSAQYAQDTQLLCSGQSLNREMSGEKPNRKFQI